MNFTSFHWKMMKKPPETDEVLEKTQKSGKFSFFEYLSVYFRNFISSLINQQKKYFEISHHC